MKKQGLIIFLVLVLCLTVGCSKKKVDADEETAVKNVITQGIQALEDENIDQYLETCFIEADTENDKSYDEVLEETRQSVLEVFNFFDLHYEIESIQVTSIEGNTATAELTQHISDRVENSVFEATTSTTRMTLTKVSGKWQVQSSEKVE